MNKERFTYQTISLGVMSFVLLNAFGRQSREEIKKRDGNKSAYSGKTGRLDASHLDHNKKNPKYDNPENGRLLTPREHYLDHYNRHARNGISTSQNIWALKQLWNRLSRQDRKGLPSPGTLE